MTVTLYHIIVPPVIACVCTVLIVIVFRRARKRSAQEVVHGAVPAAAPAPVQPDGSVTVGISQSVDKVESVSTTLQKRIEENMSMDDQIAEREKMLIKRIAANPRDAEAYDLLGQVYLVQGNLHDAAECFSQVITFEPRNLRAVEQLNKIKKITQNAQTDTEV